jgi:D-proline reductase (dithiol) PrdB
MQDSEGDPSFREINGATIVENYKITHDYYDHGDAEKDLNIIFPIERLKDLQEENIFGELNQRHFSFMGHIDGKHIATLVGNSAQQVVARLKEATVDVVLLTPA